MIPFLLDNLAVDLLSFEEMVFVVEFSEVFEHGLCRYLVILVFEHGVSLI